VSPSRGDLLNLTPELSEAFERNTSRIHGLGTFALQPILPGVVFYEIRAFAILTKPDRGTVRLGNGRHALDWRILRWVNHSCRPNSRIESRCDVPTITAIRDIEPGDEIVVDYRDTECDDEYPEPFQCNCGHCDHIWIGRSTP
jgi:SET domain-containing protein